MALITKAIKFFTLKSETRKLLVEAYILLGWARILKRIPFTKVAPSLGDHMIETSYSENNLQIQISKNVSHAIHIMSRYTFWESECLVKAIAGMKMLERRNIESTLYLGTAKDKGGHMIAHAWLRSGPYYISGSEGMERFTVVGMFAKRLSHRDVEGEKIG